jgi:hypothetical protein
MAASSGGALALALARADDDDQLEHELALVRSAIALLANGGARRVTLVGLSHGAEILPEVRAEARAHGMILRSIQRRAGCDLAIEPAG